MIRVGPAGGSGRQEAHNAASGTGLFHETHRRPADRGCHPGCDRRPGPVRPGPGVPPPGRRKPPPGWVPPSAGGSDIRSWRPSCSRPSAASRRSPTSRGSEEHDGDGQGGPAEADQGWPRRRLPPPDHLTRLTDDVGGHPADRGQGDVLRREPVPPADQAPDDERRCHRQTSAPTYARVEMITSPRIIRYMNWSWPDARQDQPGDQQAERVRRPGGSSAGKGARKTNGAVTAPRTRTGSRNRASRRTVRR